jgi:surface antigen
MGRPALSVSIAALVAGALMASSPKPATSTPLRVQQPSSRVVFGYPYAARCPAAGFANTVVDRWGMYACNCTSYVAWALVANHQRVDWFVPGAMNAWNWPNVARRALLRVDRVAAPGTVVVWPSLARPFGHVAYVIRVHRSRTIDVAEYNYPGADDTNTYVFDIRRFVSPVGGMFIHVPPDGRRRSSQTRSPRR